MKKDKFTGTLPQTLNTSSKSKN